MRHTGTRQQRQVAGASFPHGARVCVRRHTAVRCGGPPGAAVAPAAAMDAPRQQCTCGRASAHAAASPCDAQNVVFSALPDVYLKLRKVRAARRRASLAQAACVPQTRPPR